MGAAEALPHPGAPLRAHLGRPQELLASVAVAVVDILRDLADGQAVARPVDDLDLVARG